MKKRLLSLLLAAACLMPLSGCDWGEEPEETYDTLSQYYQQSDSTKQDTRLTSFGLPYLQGETWDPITCADGAQQTLGALLYESLYTLGTDFLPQPCLAESASYDAESYALTVTVRSGVTFSDGSTLTAWDVVAALRRAKESVRYGQRLAEMDSVSYLGESTLRIYLTRNDPQFAARLDIPIIKGGTQEDTVPVGSGPYRYVKDESGVYLARRTDWWQDKTMPLERIELTACKNTDSMAYAFYTHDIQMLVCDLTGTNTSNVYGSGSYTDIPTSTMQYIGFNVTRAPFNDPKLRAALSLGMDRAGGVSAFLLGHGQTAQFPLSPSAVVYPKDLEETYSPDSYRSAMETAGYTSGEKSVSVTMLVNEENSFKVSMARKLASDLSQYDVKIDVKTLPYEDYLGGAEGRRFRPLLRGVQADGGLGSVAAAVSGRGPELRRRAGHTAGDPADGLPNGIGGRRAPDSGSGAVQLSEGAGAVGGSVLQVQLRAAAGRSGEKRHPPHRLRPLCRFSGLAAEYEKLSPPENKLF